MEKLVKALQKDFIVEFIPSFGSGIFINTKNRPDSYSIAFLDTRQMSSAFLETEKDRYEAEINAIKEVIMRFYGL